MTTLYLVNGFLAGDSNHAQYLNSPRYEMKKVYRSPLNYVAYAIGGASRAEKEMLTLGEHLDKMQFCIILRKEKEWIAEYEAMKKIVGDDTLYLLTFDHSPVMTVYTKDIGMDIEFRPDGSAYGTGGKFAKAQFHLQAVRGEFDLEEIMKVACKYDPQSKGEITIINGHTLNDSDLITKEMYNETYGEEK